MDALGAAADSSAAAQTASQPVSANASSRPSDALALAEARRVLEEISRLADAALKKGAPHPQPQLKRIRDLATHTVRRLSQP